MQEQGERKAERGDIARSSPESRAPLRCEGHTEHDEHDDAEDMRVAEAAVPENAETGEAGDDSSPEEHRPGARSARNFPIARERDESSDDRDQADGGVKSAERGQSEHAALLAEVRRIVGRGTRRRNR